MIILLSKFNRYFNQFFLFALIGGSCFTVDSGILIILIKLCQMNAIEARIVSFLLATLTSWFLNRTFTFSAQEKRIQLLELLKFIAFSCIGGSINFFIYTCVILYLGQGITVVLLALIFSTGVSMFFNFFAYKFLVFNEQKVAINLSGADK